jgi:hypothetical protein
MNYSEAFHIVYPYVKDWEQESNCSIISLTYFDVMRNSDDWCTAHGITVETLLDAWNKVVGFNNMDTISVITCIPGVEEAILAAMKLDTSETVASALKDLQTTDSNQLWVLEYITAKCIEWSHWRLQSIRDAKARQAKAANNA